MPYLAGIQTKANARFNYYNPDDYTLVSGYVNSSFGSWEFNNRGRPVYSYDYEGLIDTWGQLSRFYRYHLYQPDFPPDAPVEKIEDGDMLFPDEIHEIFSHADEARSQALGAMRDVTIFVQRDLNEMFHYDDTRMSHSREFLSNVVDEDLYWLTVMDDAGLPTSSPPREN